ncbi:hypothetical protein BC829DRAFT_381724, partial [Chytridium lagenaria]
MRKRRSDCVKITRISSTPRHSVNSKPSTLNSFAPINPVSKILMISCWKVWKYWRTSKNCIRK